MSDVTAILVAIQQGDSHAADELLPLVYDELRKLAAQRMAQEKPGQTLQATALVHEAYLRLMAGVDTSAQPEQNWDSRGHFFAAAAEAMRRILIDLSRHKASQKRGGDRKRLNLEEPSLVSTDEQWHEELLALDQALSELQQHDAQAAQLVKLRYFAGLGHQEAAEAMGISRRTADRLWALAKALLFQRLQNE